MSLYATLGGGRRVASARAAARRGERLVGHPPVAARAIGGDHVAVEELERARALAVAARAGLHPERHVDRGRAGAGRHLEAPELRAGREDVDGDAAQAEAGRVEREVDVTLPVLARQRQVVAGALVVALGVEDHLLRGEPLVVR